MTSKLVVNTIEADTGISSVSFASSISMSSTSKFHFGDAGIDIGADTNINRPASGVLGFNINGSEKARIDSNGAVMIRTTTAGAHSSDLTIGGTTGGGRIMIRSASNAGGYIGFQDTTGSTVDGQIEYNHILNSFNFYFGSQERFRIHTQGMLGLSGANYGTSGQVLTSGGTGSPVSWTTITGTTINNRADNRVLTATGSDNVLNAESNVHIDGSGRLMIGTTNEGNANADDLTIATTGHTGITLRSGTSNYGQIFFSDAESGTGEYEGIIAYDHSNNSMVFHTTRAERLRIDSVGRVMIGTTTEGNGNADEFTISYINHAGVSGGDQGRCGMTIRSGDNTSGVTQNGYIYFSDGTSGSNESMGVVAYEHSTDSMYFSTAQVARLRINSTGNMSLGGIDPVPTSTSYNTASFHIHQTTNATNVGAQVHLTTANKGSAAGDGAQISQYNGNLYINNQDDGNMYFLNNSNSTIRMTITSAGALGFAGANYGTAGQVLKSGGSGAAPTWGSAGGHTETYGLAIFGAVYDTNSGYIVHNITSGSGNGVTIDTSNERMTPTVSGTYLVIYNAHWLGLHNSGATYYNRITKNGSEYLSSNFSAYNPGSHMHTVMTTIPMNGSSDYVQFEFYENKSGAAAYVSAKSRAVMILLDT